MTKILNHISTYADLTAYNNDLNKDYPNVSYIQASDEVKWNKYNPYPRVIAKYNVTSTSEATRLSPYNNTSFAKAYLNGVEINKYSYTFDTLGEHTVEFELNETTTINNNTFESIPALISVFIPNTVTTLGTYVFAGSKALTNVSLSPNITEINNYMFQRCSSLTNIKIPNGVTSIGDNAFSKCTSLTSIIIPNSVTSIGDYAFDDCRGLTSVTVLATTPPTLSPLYVFSNTNNCPIYVPAESVDTYKTATNWSSLASRIQAIPTT